MFDDSLQLLPNHQNQQYPKSRIVAGWSSRWKGNISLGDSKMIHNHPQFQWKLSQEAPTWATWPGTCGLGSVIWGDRPRFGLIWTTRARGRSFRKKNLTTKKSLPIECLQVRPCVGIIFCDPASDHPPLHDISFDIFVVSFSWHLCLFTSLYIYIYTLVCLETLSLDMLSHLVLSVLALSCVLCCVASNTSLQDSRAPAISQNAFRAKLP